MSISCAMEKAPIALPRGACIRSGLTYAVVIALCEATTLRPEIEASQIGSIMTACGATLTLADVCVVTEMDTKADAMADDLKRPRR